MKKWAYLFIGILGLALSACSHTVVETLNVPDPPKYSGAGAGKTILLLPFADYSSGDSVESAFRRNMLVTETFTDRLTANGFSMPVNEDVFDYLVAQKIINLLPYEKRVSVSLANELSGDWSDSMKEEIKKYTDSSVSQSGQSSLNSPGTHGLNNATIAKLGRQFNADYVIRGRILEFKTRDTMTWEPWKKGLIPFITGVSDRFFFGFASSDSYDELNESTTGMILGARQGYKSEWPFKGNGDTILGFSGGDDANAILWGAIGSDIGKQSHYSGKIDQAAVQLRVWVQEASTGNVVWTNRISVKVSPESFLADKQYDTLFNKAIEKGVTTLVDNFISYGL